MAEELLKFYNELTLEQQKEAFDFVIFLYNKNDSTIRKSNDIFSKTKISSVDELFEFAHNAPHNKNPEIWTREELHERG